MQFFAQGGTEALVVRVHREDGEPIGDAEVQAGLRVLGQGTPFNLLVLPRLPTAVPGAWRGLSTESRGAAVAICAHRRAVFIADPPDGWTGADEAVAGRLATGLGETPDAALYMPDILAPDPLQPGPPVRFGPSAAVAGVIARTDAAQGVWKAPAGIGAPLPGLQGLSLRLTEREIARLNEQGINTLRDVPPHGPLVWGARTLAGADELHSEWKYLPVRRLALHIGESLRDGLQWVALEPNGEPLWAGIRRAAGGFLHALFRRGAFQGMSPRDSYFVRCGVETTTQADLAAGIVDLEVGFAPLKPAEFVVLRIRLAAGGG
jgi:phage tail sheath protein FI